MSKRKSKDVTPIFIPIEKLISICRTAVNWGGKVKVKRPRKLEIKPITRKPRTGRKQWKAVMKNA